MSKANKKKKHKKRGGECPRCKGKKKITVRDESGREKIYICDLCRGSGRKKE